MFGFELAYIDPGSGSLIIQGAIATIVAAPSSSATRSPACLGRRGGGVRGPDVRHHADPADTHPNSEHDAAPGG